MSGVVAIAGAGGGLGPSVIARLDGPLAGADVSAQRLSDGLDDARAVDLLDPAATTAWANDLEARFGEVRALVHLVGGWRGGKPLGEADPSDWTVMEGLLIRSLQNTSRAFLDPLKRSGGRLVMISAAAAKRPTSSNAAYAAAKAAAEAWTLAVADEFTGTGATANILAVNAILTPEMRAAKPDAKFATFTRAEDIADGIAFLLSDAAAKMNGQRIALHPA
ncbi:SDR family oxidoreductase [Solirubrobacter ginsenosidimutans]|uniref:SDR family oxidoreductase n=1 Tax=Solirubrobacter ginsenosidimutans TaxID=490573 RepID=A0A9X3MV48_9ACTN|nr:SDR family oxidoreductase [Solirubrobacter ginsenosidimutans]MDA0160433.1 SDR family oxidoreductase [Solirubrobacter ginsenosidimutans]